MLRSVELDRIRIDTALQARDRMREEVVRDYAEAIERGEEFPPVLLYCEREEEGIDYLLVDGFHRIEAFRRVMPGQGIRAEVCFGTEDDARWAALGVNCSHGLRRTNADKRRAVLLALRHPKGVKLSNRQIASHTGVSEFMVRSIRSELASGAILSQRKRRSGQSGVYAPRDSFELRLPNEAILAAVELRHLRGEAWARDLARALLSLNVDDAESLFLQN